MANEWVIFYNGAGGFQQVALGKEDEYVIEHSTLFKKFESIKEN